MKHMKKVVWVLLACAVLVVVNELIGGKATEYFFSPDTLEIRCQRVSAESISVWPRSPVTYSSKLLAYLVDHGYVQPVATDQPRWLSIGRFSPRWKDGQGQLMYVFVWRQDSQIEWCRADPARAKLLWSTVFPLLRSDNKHAVLAGEAIAREGTMFHDINVEELQKKIDETLQAHRVRSPVAVQP